MKKVCIIGGGAGGLMSAYAAAKKGHEVILFEKNEKLGKKIYITGKGRCNFTNDVSHEEFLQNLHLPPQQRIATYFYLFFSPSISDYNFSIADKISSILAGE